LAQVTIYLPAGTLEAVKAAAAKKELSVSQWFAQYAHAQESKNTKTWSQFLDHLDTTFGEESKDGLDFLLNDDRNADLAPTRDREPL
jgi:hypothetical protein